MGPKQQISTAYAAEMATTFYLAQLSDRIGRKFVFLACGIGLSVSIGSFGLSTTFWALIIWFVLRLK
jgi:MFS family permease